MKNKIVLGLVLLILIIGAYMCFSGKSNEKVAAVPPPVVGVTRVILSDLPVNFEVPAKVYASKETEIRAQVSGIIKSRSFKEGEYVPKGKSLFVIDKDKYLNAYNSAKGSLAQAESEMKRATRDYKRIEKLFKDGAVSQKQHDDALSQYEKAAANLDVAKANLDTAKINLDYTDVTAPISGIVRKEELSVGNLIQTTGLLTSIFQVDPLHVHFSISGIFWSKMSTGYRNGTLKLLQPEDYKVELILDDGTKYPEIGKIIFIDSAEDPKTGCILIKAEFKNNNKRVLPGQFVRVNVIGAAYKNALIIPSSAVISSSVGQVVYKVLEDNTVKVVPVKVKLIKNHAVVMSGLVDGDRIVFEGIVKARPGQKITPVGKNQDIISLTSSEKDQKNENSKSDENKKSSDFSNEKEKEQTRA